MALVLERFRLVARRGALGFSVNFKSYHLMLDDSILESEPVKW